MRDPRSTERNVSSYAWLLAPASLTSSARNVRETKRHTCLARLSAELRARAIRPVRAEDDEVVVDGDRGAVRCNECGVKVQAIAGAESDHHRLARHARHNNAFARLHPSKHDGAAVISSNLWQARIGNCGQQMRA